MKPSDVAEHVKQKDWNLLMHAGLIGPDSGPTLIPLLENPDSQVRELAVACLAAAGGVPARHGLLKALRDRVETVRAAAARNLAEHYQTEDLPKIESELTSSADPYVREQLSLLLGKSGRTAEIALLTQRFSGERDEHARHAYSIAMARLGDQGRRHEWMAHLTAEPPSERVAALRDLPYLNDKSLLVYILPLLDDVRPGLTVGPSFQPHQIRVCDVAVNQINEMLGKPFPFADPFKKYSPQEIALVKAAIARP